MKRNYRTEYFKLGFMGNRYKIGELEYSATDKEIEHWGSIPNVGIGKNKSIHRHFLGGINGVTTYTSITIEINKSALLVVADGVRGILKLTADQLRGK